MEHGTILADDCLLITYETGEWNCSLRWESGYLKKTRALTAHLLKKAGEMTSVILVWKKRKKFPLFFCGEILHNGNFVKADAVPQKMSISIHWHILMRNTFIRNFPTTCWSCQQCLSMEINPTEYSSPKYSAGITQLIHVLQTFGFIFFSTEKTKNSLICTLVSGFCQDQSQNDKTF